MTVKALFEAGGKFLERVAGLAMKINAGEMDIVSAVAEVAAPAIAHIFKVCFHMKLVKLPYKSFHFTPIFIDVSGIAGETMRQ